MRSWDRCKSEFEPSPKIIISEILVKFFGYFVEMEATRVMLSGLNDALCDYLQFDTNHVEFGWVSPQIFSIFSRHNFPRVFTTTTTTKKCYKN